MNFPVSNEVLWLSWIRRKEKLNIEILTPLKRSTNKTLKNYWFLPNLVKHHLYFIGFPANKLLRNCKFYIYV